MGLKVVRLYLVLIASVVQLGCGLQLKIEDLSLKIKSAFPTVNFSLSQLKTVPNVSSLPVDGEVTVQFCLADDQGQPLDDDSYAIVFSLMTGSSGTFSSVVYDDADHCYESTFRGVTPGASSAVVVKNGTEVVTPSSPVFLEVRNPILNFTGNSELSSLNIDDRIVRDTAGTFSLTGACEYLLGDVQIKAPGIKPLQIFNTPCLADNTFTFGINAGNTTPPYFDIASSDPLIQVRQRLGRPVMTRIIYIGSRTLAKITTPAELQSIPSGNGPSPTSYVLMNNLDLMAQPFTPIGNSPTVYFRGVFYGEGHEISNLSITSALDHVGLFGYVNGSFISDLKLTNVNVIGDTRVGALAGQSLNSTFTRISSSGTVAGSYYVGLVVGQLWESNVYQSWAAGNVNANQTLGGLVGYSMGGLIDASWAQANATGSAGSYDVGGLLGGLTDSTNDGRVRNSFALGSATGDEAIGGIVGRASKVGFFATSYVQKSFSLASVNALIASPVSYGSGYSLGHAGSSGNISPYIPSPAVIATDLFHLSTLSCANCQPGNAHSSARSLNDLLSWAESNWDYEWTWERHSSGTRPDLINNPRP